MLIYNPDPLMIGSYILKGARFMDRRIKTKVITTVICLVLSLFALYTFSYLLDISNGWRIFLILLAISWITTGIINLRSYFKK